MGRKKKQLYSREVSVSDIDTPGDLSVKPGFSNTFVPTEYVDNEDKAKAERAFDATEKDWSALPGLAIDDQWITSGIGRFAERDRYTPPVEGFKVSDEELDALPYKMEDKQYLKEAVSPEDFRQRQVWLDEDLKRKQALAAYGWQGAGASFIAAVADPVGWGVAFVTGPEALALKGGRVAKAGATALAFGTQGAATEALLATGDTQKGAKDVLHGFAFGAVLGGGLGALARHKPDAALDVHLSDVVDDAVRREAGALREADLSHTVDLDRPTFLRRQEELPVGPQLPVEHVPEVAPEVPGRTFRPAPAEDTGVITAADINTRHPELRDRIRTSGEDHNYPAEANLFDGEDATHPPFKKVVDETVRLDRDEVARAIASHRKNLEAQVRMEFRGRKGKALRAELEGKAEMIQADLEEMLSTMNAHRAQVAASQGAARTADELTRFEFRLQNIEDIYKPTIMAAERKLSQIEDRLNASREAKGARRLVPLSNALGVGQALNYLLE